jgi:heat shock protein HslJ
MDPMKKILFLAIVLVVSSLFITSCQPGTAQPGPTITENAATSVPPAPSATPSTAVEILPTATPQPTAAAPEPAPGVSLSLEGQSWILLSYVDAGGVQKTPVGNTQITATFENGRLAGNASCNSYFASYQLNGNKLTISNAGSTMMACLAPGVMVQEAAYLEALQKAATFQIQAGQLEIADAQAKTILVFSGMPQGTQLPASAQTPAAQASLSLESLKNADFRSGFTESGRAPLYDGEYREAGPQGSASETVVKLVEPVAYGELPDGQVAAAVALATETGGSGTFYELTLVVDLNGAPLNIALVFLGDRIKLNSLKIENGQVLVDMVKQGPDDAMCCPTLHVLQKYALQGADLALVSSEEIK